MFVDSWMKHKYNYLIKLKFHRFYGIFLDERIINNTTATGTNHGHTVHLRSLGRKGLHCSSDRALLTVSLAKSRISRSSLSPALPGPFLPCPMDCIFSRCRHPLSECQNIQVGRRSPVCLWDGLWCQL